jgi:hypothetical protein
VCWPQQYSRMFPSLLCPSEHVLPGETDLEEGLGRRLKCTSGWNETQALVVASAWLLLCLVDMQLLKVSLTVNRMVKPHEGNSLALGIWTGIGNWWLALNDSLWASVLLGKTRKC